ncbi:hypothetical protein TNIN_98651 [Trichonephila inaurata madagascariensis]|uniref:Uncharacterized protein n=1 Tax=Trichonephila inaurata madagascariensis TaxID=2747483 RepID=A0A8X6YDD0_9ARAC|nr:hypothetical protein TNIN_98651 [Trichonephila inaurata madagascariensis]
MTFPTEGFFYTLPLGGRLEDYLHLTLTANVLRAKNISLGTGRGNGVTWIFQWHFCFAGRPGTTPLVGLPRQWAFQVWTDSRPLLRASAQPLNSWAPLLRF